ncbi:hypothetical protein B0H14DRAFT_2642876 [Mycena olivaceomarginata]|nr:hypothetical protein B0H14DRAFT_2642876 [Mycena olivaceomarginata]
MSTYKSFAVVEGGTVGLPIVNTLAEQNVSVLLLSRPGSSTKTVPSSIQVIQVDFNDTTAVAAVFKEHKVDVVLSTVALLAVAVGGSLVDAAKLAASQTLPPIEVRQEDFHAVKNQIFGKEVYCSPRISTNLSPVHLKAVNIPSMIIYVRCGRLLKHNASSNTTSNLLNHTRDCAPKPDLFSQQGMMRSFVSGSTFKHGKLRTLTTLWVTWRRRPFKIVEDPEFRKIIHLFNPSAHKHSAGTQACDVRRLYKLSRNKTRIFLAVY